MRVIDRDRYNGRPVQEFQFDSMDEITQAQNRDKSYCSSKGWGYWLGTKNFEEYEAKVAGDWPELVEKLRKMIDQLPRADVAVTRNIRNRRKRTRGDDGSEVDMDRVYQGRMDVAWEKTERVPKYTQQNKLVHVFIQAGGTHLYQASDFMWKAAAAFRIIEMLQANGHSVAITLGNVSEGIFGSFAELTVTSVPVKSYGQEVSDNRLAVMMNGSFYRVEFLNKAYFASERIPSEGRGRSVHDTGLLPLQLQREKDDGAMIVTVAGCFDRESAERVIETVIKQLSKPE